MTYFPGLVELLTDKLQNDAMKCDFNFIQEMDGVLLSGAVMFTRHRFQSGTSDIFISAMVVITLVEFIMEDQKTISNYGYLQYITVGSFIEIYIN